VLIVCVCPILERLVANVTAAGRPDNVREASLEALGYICQDIVSSFIHPCVCVRVAIFPFVSMDPFSGFVHKEITERSFSLGIGCSRTPE
jgi:hypothetical protein